MSGSGRSPGLIDFGRVLAHVREAAVIVDLSSRHVLAANRSYLERSGYDRAETGSLDLSHMYDFADLERILQSASRGGPFGTLIPGVSCLTRAGGSFRCDLTVTPLDEGESALTLLVHSSPATEERARTIPTGLEAFTLPLAGIGTTGDLERALTDASRDLMGATLTLLVASSAREGAPDIVVSNVPAGPARDALSAWVGGMIAAGLLSTDAPRVLTELPQDIPLETMRGAMREEGCDACILFALESEGRLAGAWVLGYPDARSAGACDLAAGRTYAAHIARSLAGALLMERTLQEKRHHEVLNRITTWLRGSFDLDDILRSLTGELCRALQADRCLVLTVATGDEEDAQLRVQDEHVEGGLPALDRAGTILFGGTDLAAAVLFSRGPLAVEDLLVRPDLVDGHEDLIGRLGARGIVLAKIVSRQVMTGVLAVVARSRRRWSPAEIELVRAVADYAALTIETAQLATSSRERAEQVERERREWERSFDAIPDMLAIHDGYGRLLRTNLAMQVRLGKDPREFIGRECTDVLAAVMGEPQDCPHEEATRQRRSIVREVQGATGIFSLTAIPCFDAAGLCLYIIHVCKDITEEKHIREQLLQSEKMAAVGGLVSGVAHELNNPLSGVVGFSELLLNSSEEPKLRKSLQRIHDEANRAARIVRNLLTFARKHKPESVRVDINAVLEKTLDLRAYELRVNRIKTVLELSRDLPPTFADPNQLVQVFMNIIANADQAMREANGKGTLTIRSARRGETIRIEIADDGPGIAPQHIKKIFDPFFTTKPLGKGTGLGLSICDGILKEHGGAIEVASVPGQGTTFSIVLPVVAGEPDRTDVVIPADRRVAPARVLVVDDEPHVRDLLQIILGERGHAVDAVEGGLAALKRIEAGGYDLIVSDVKMPEMDGRELFARLKADHPALATRVLFISGDTVAADSRSFLDETGQPYILKPFRARDLIDGVERLLESTRTASKPTN